MTRYTKSDVRKLTVSVNEEAHLLDLLNENETVEFQPGSVTNGLSPYFYVEATGDDGRRRSAASAAFLPDSFTSRSTATEVYKTLEATYAALIAVRRSL